MRQPLGSQCCNNFSFLPIHRASCSQWFDLLASVTPLHLQQPVVDLVPWLTTNAVAMPIAVQDVGLVPAVGAGPSLVPEPLPLGWPWSPIVPGWVIAGPWLSFGCTFVGSSGWPLGLVPHVAGGHSGWWAQWLLGTVAANHADGI